MFAPFDNMTLDETIAVCQLLKTMRAQQAAPTPIPPTLPTLVRMPKDGASVLLAGVGPATLALARAIAADNSTSVSGSNPAYDNSAAWAALTKRSRRLYGADFYTYGAGGKTLISDECLVALRHHFSLDASATTP